MAFKNVNNKVDFVEQEEILNFWRDTDAFNELRRLRAASEKEHGIFSFIDGPITANNPMGVHHAWSRTYKDLFQRYQAMLGKTSAGKTASTARDCGSKSTSKNGSASTASAKLRRSASTDSHWSASARC